MKEWLKDNIMSSLTLSAIVIGAVWYGASEERWFTDSKTKHKTEETIYSLDPIKLYGEYITDSIEEVHTQAWRLQQEKKDSSLNAKINSLDSLLRLNVRLTNETKKTAQQIEEGH